MPISFDERVNLERDLDEEQLSEVRFGRSRFLRDAGLALFGLAAGVFVPNAPAHAAPPPGCYGANKCRSCAGCRCTRCARRANNSCGGRHCWRIRVNGRCYRCCDWVNRRGRLCICRCRC